MDTTPRPSDQILGDVYTLLKMWKNGLLGGKTMPEDVHPALPATSKTLLHYFTLGMCLNYQRNSYALWKACTATFNDYETSWVFEPATVAEQSPADVSAALLKHKVAQQPQRHLKNWVGNCAGIVKFCDGDLRSLLRDCAYDLEKIRAFIRDHKKDFPYLCGPKLCDYWLFVLIQYTDFKFLSRDSLSVAPDTHVIQASCKLGLISALEMQGADAARIVADRWAKALEHETLSPIDVHTPLWLWSRGGFRDLTL